MTTEEHLFFMEEAIKEGLEKEQIVKSTKKNKKKRK